MLMRQEYTVHSETRADVSNGHTVTGTNKCSVRLSWVGYLTNMPRAANCYLQAAYHKELQLPALSLTGQLLVEV